MKKTIILAVIALASIAQAEPLVFTNQTVTVDPAHLSLESVQFIPAAEANPAQWVLQIKFELPRGHAYPLNGHNVSMDRFRCYIPITASAAEVQSIFAAAYPAIEFAASNGEFIPTGPIRDGFLLIAATNLAAPAGE